MSAQSSYLNKKGLTVKDLVTIGIFTALFFVFELIGSLPFAPNPALTFYQPFGIALLCGPVYLLMVAKVPKRGGTLAPRNMCRATTSYISTELQAAPRWCAIWILKAFKRMYCAA